VHCGAAAAERVEHDIAFVAAGGDDAFEQGEGSLRGVTKAFAANCIDPKNSSYPGAESIGGGIGSAD
jgi:hypothetical protein